MITRRQLSATRGRCIRENQAFFLPGRGYVGQILILRATVCPPFSGSGTRLNFSCDFSKLPLTEGCATEIHFTHSVFLYEQSKDNSQLRWPFIWVHHHHGCPFSSFLFNFGIEMVVKEARFSYENSGIDTCSDSEPDIWAARLKIIYVIIWQMSGILSVTHYG